MANKIDEEINKSVNKIDRGIDEVRESKYIQFLLRIIASGVVGIVCIAILAPMDFGDWAPGFKEGALVGWTVGIIAAVSTFRYLKRRARLG